MTTKDSADEQTPILPAHIEDTVRSIAELHAEHHRNATLYQKTIDRLTASVGRPSFIGVVTIFIATWVGVNLGLSFSHHKPFDPAPFSWLQGIIAITALYVTVLILTTQRRENQLAEQRTQLTLEIALVSEQKMAKLIEMNVQQRHDNPLLESTYDAQATAMSAPANPEAMLDAIKQSHGEILAANASTGETTV